MTALQQHSRQVRESLRRAVSKAMETKRRLGQYAVIYRDGKPVRLNPEHIGKTQESLAMALHPDFPDSPHAILDPEIRWFTAPAHEA